MGVRSLKSFFVNEMKEIKINEDTRIAIRCSIGKHLRRSKEKNQNVSHIKISIMELNEIQKIKMALLVMNHADVENAQKAYSKAC